MHLLTEIPLPVLLSIVNILGLPGLIFIFWYVDGRRFEKIFKQNQSEASEYRQYYESNVTLVEGYEELAKELVTIIRLNTQVQTSLIEKIDNNMFCPAVRDNGPSRRNNG